MAVQPMLLVTVNCVVTVSACWKRMAPGFMLDEEEGLPMALKSQRKLFPTELFKKVTGSFT